MGRNLVVSMEKLAGNVCGGQIKSRGHVVMEEQPGEVAHMLLHFFHGEEFR